MKLVCGENVEFEMNVVGYQFPHVEHVSYDSDWLNVHVSVTHPRGSWSKTDACLLTFELAQLIEWLRNLATDNLAHSVQDFMEPELSFEWFGGDRNILRIYLDFSLRPSWSPCHGVNEEKELFVEFALNPEYLRNLAAYLRGELKRFPVRLGM